MKTSFRIALTFCLATGLLAFPSQVLADDPPPTKSQIIDGVLVEPIGYEQTTDVVPLADSPTIYFKTLTGLDFHPIDSDMLYHSLDGGLYPLAPLVPGFGFSAAFTLPNGASVTGITFFAIDNDPTDISLGVYRYHPAIDDSDTLSTTTTTGAASGIRSFNATGSLPFTINNSTYAYRLRVEFRSPGGTQTLYGARITYTIPSTPPSGYQYVTMAGADFRSSNSNMTYAAIGGTLYATATASSYYFYTRLDLPEGAVINEVRWFLIDNHAEYFNLRLYTHTVSSDTFGIAASASTDGDDPVGAVRTLIDDDSITVDN